MKQITKHAVLFLIGAALYFEVELNWRYFTDHLPVHWSMAVVGGVMFVLIGGINEWITWDMSLPLQALVGMVVVTSAELISGLILNVHLGLNIWDYSHIPFNIHGQICLPFTIAWFALSFIAVVLDDFLRWKLFGEDFPHYKLL